MSGGVDSSVAAYLTKKMGYDCIGVTMKLATGLGSDLPCCNTRDIEDAAKVADKLGIPFEVVDYGESFSRNVIHPFIDSYLAGQTPNPCILCNKCMKFAELYRYGKERGCDYIVTGHYVRIIRSEEGFHLFKGKDSSKDQSYVLYFLTPEQLSHTLFPLGDYSKDEIRNIARELGFANSEKKESQDICFIPDGDYRGFIERVTGTKSVPGDFVDQDGNVVGKHKGYYAYTVGQRKGLGLSAPVPWYVTEIRPKANQVVLGHPEDLMGTRLIADTFNWIEKPDPEETLGARVRYHQNENPCHAMTMHDGRVEIVFEKPLRAITRGQSVVLYRGDQVIGGGVIVE